MGLCPMRSDVSSSINSRVSGGTLDIGGRSSVCGGELTSSGASSTATGSSISEWTTDSRGAPQAQCARGARAVQLFGRLAVLETHTLRY